MTAVEIFPVSVWLNSEQVSWASELKGSWDVLPVQRPVPVSLLRLPQDSICFIDSLKYLKPPAFDLDIVMSILTWFSFTLFFLLGQERGSESLLQQRCSSARKVSRSAKSVKLMCGQDPCCGTVTVILDGLTLPGCGFLSWSSAVSRPVLYPNPLDHHSMLHAVIPATFCLQLGTYCWAVAS